MDDMKTALNAVRQYGIISKPVVRDDGNNRILSWQVKESPDFPKVDGNNQMFCMRVAPHAVDEILNALNHTQ